MKQTEPIEEHPFQLAFRGSFTSALRWHHLDALWKTLKDQQGDDWYIYAIGHPPPDSLVSREKLHEFIDEIDRLIRTEHAEDYCGIVYADKLADPALIKIYDPHNLGVSCGYSDNPPLPGWVLSKIPPCDLNTTQMVGGARKRWWERIFKTG